MESVAKSSRLPGNCPEMGFQQGDCHCLSGVAFEAVFKAFNPSEGLDEWFDKERKREQTRKDVTDE